MKSAIDALELSTSLYAIDSVMTFGGEPLLYPEITCRIHQKAYELGVSVRQIITNGYWTKSRERTLEIAEMLKESNVNNILVSVDAFHQEYLDFDHVKFTILKLAELNFHSLKMNPCWYDSPDGHNKYDRETRSLLRELLQMGVKTARGNVMFPDQGATANFPERFTRKLDFSGKCCTDVPYMNFPDQVDTVCLDADGTVSICNGRKYSFERFISDYDPYQDRGISIMLSHGIDKLIEEAEKIGIHCQSDGYYSLCDLCTDLRKRMESKMKNSNSNCGAML